MFNVFHLKSFLFGTNLNKFDVKSKYPIPPDTEYPIPPDPLPQTGKGEKGFPGVYLYLTPLTPSPNGEGEKVPPCLGRDLGWGIFCGGIQGGA
jgi:hypothetical protein